MRLEEDGRVELPTLNLEEEILMPAGTKLIQEEVHGT